MKRRLPTLVAACLALFIIAVPQAQAQLAVIDVPAIVQFVKSLIVMAEQLETAREQLLQARQEWAAMTGDRGMENLLSGINRNYLPTDWTQLLAALQSGGGYAGLSADVQNLMNTNAVLTTQRLGTLSPAGQQQVRAMRQWGAMQQALAHEALANVSSRFAAVQSLIDRIGGAGDQKAILDLQARIGAELGMLQNEQTKLQMLTQSTQAQQSALAWNSREQVLAAHGRFDTRFQPTP
jgi:type IV secretion system protein VirB5